MAGAHAQEIDLAFANNEDLRKRIHAAIDGNPTQNTLFRDISTYILNQSSQNSTEPIAKKRKLDGNASNGTHNGPPAAQSSLLNPSTEAWRSYSGVSFSLPQRKKLTLQLVAGRDGGIRAVGADGKIEFGISCKDVEQVFCLPVPEKAKRQHNFIVLPFHADGVNPLPDHLQASPPEPILWTFEEATGKNIVEGEDPGPTPLADGIWHCLNQAGTPRRVIFPDPDEFASAIVQNHRKGEKAFHVKAHRGSKEGYLFFTSVGVVYGFKKPLAFFDFASIDSISYTSVLRNTFNIVIATPSQSIEFGMVDQADYPGINEYVQNHNLQDASLAAERRAKKLNVNPPGENGTNSSLGTEGEEGETELQKAERLLQEEEDEDEDEEDYDPGSEGESEGSGSDTEDDDDDDEGGQHYEPEEVQEGEGVYEDEEVYQKGREKFDQGEFEDMMEDVPAIKLVPRRRNH